MYLFHIFRSFLPLRNPIGFGAADFILFAITALLVLCMLFWPILKPHASRLAASTRWSMLALAALSILLRLLLWPRYPAPPPQTAADFSRSLMAGNLLRARLATPPPPLPQFFETTPPALPLGQSLPHVLGDLLTGNAYFGVLLTSAAFCSLSYWMLHGFTAPAWALLGGALVLAVDGPLSRSANSYSGAALSAAACCLVFGSLSRLLIKGSKRYAVLLGIGLALELLVMPVEGALLVAGVALFFTRRALLRPYFTQALPFVLLAAILLVAQHRTAGIDLDGWPLNGSLACLALLSAVWALARCRPFVVQCAVFLCFSRFLFWYGLHLAGPPGVIADISQFEAWDLVHASNSGGRAPVEQELSRLGGQHLVFVRYPQRFSNWIHNAAALDQSRIIWARDLGPAENQVLLHYYPARTPWTLNPAARPIKLQSYRQP